MTTDNDTEAAFFAGHDVAESEVVPRRRRGTLPFIAAGVTLVCSLLSLAVVGTVLLSEEVLHTMQPVTVQTAEAPPAP